MATQLSFTEEFDYDDDPFGITIPVMLSYGATDILVSAKVDTGAQVCLFSHEDGLKLGIPIEQGLFTKLDSLGGPLEAFGHEVTIHIIRRDIFQDPINYRRGFYCCFQLITLPLSYMKPVHKSAEPRVQGGLEPLW